MRAAQEILAEGGYDALNSNAVVERAGLTPPAFYRYFKNKHQLLGVLAQRLLDESNELVEPILKDSEGSFTIATAGIQQLLRADIELFRQFTGSRELLVLMRALPELRELRLASHDFMADQLAQAAGVHYPQLSDSVLRIRTRLASDLYYNALELLFDTEFRDLDEIITRTAVAVQCAIYRPGEN